MSFKKTRSQALVVGLLVLAGQAPAGAAEKARLSGRVTDPQDRPIAGAAVRLACEGASEALSATTDDAGRFELAGPDETACTLRVAADGFADDRSTHTLSADGNDVTVELVLAGVRGEVVVTAMIPELATESRYPGADVLDRGAHDLAGFFRDVAGAGAVRRGPVNLEPQIRGLQEEQVGMFVDGTRTFAAGPARMDSSISHVGTHAAQNLRVVKGPYALAWGAGTLSALRIDTFTPSFSTGGFEWHGGAGVAWGENADNLDAHAGVWGGGERFRLYLHAGRREGDDYQAGDGSVVPGDYASTDTRWRFGFRPDEHLLIDFSGGYQDQFDIDYPGRLLDATYFYARSYVLDVTWRGDDRVSEISGQVYSNRKDHLMNNDEKPTGRDAPGRIPPFALDVALPTESNTHGGRFKVAGEHADVDWTVGLDYYGVEQTAERTVARRANGFVIFRDVVWPDAEIEDLGGYGQLVYQGDGYRVGATVRLDDVEASAGEVSPFFLANTSGATDQSETHVSAAVSATFDLGDRWSLQAGIGRAVRTATVLERYSDRFPSTKFQIAAEFMGDPDIDPEESLELDLGLRGSWGGFQVDVDTFYREIDDYITVTPDPSLPRRLPLSPPVVFRYVNGSGATFYGGELLVRHRVDPRFSWRGAVSYVWAEDEQFDEPVLGIPPLHAELGLRYHGGRRFWLDLGARFADRQERVAAARFEQETPGYAVYDLGAWIRVGDRLALRAGIDNLADRGYADHLNSPNPFTRHRILEIGRSFRLGFELDF